jgi:FKBP-type peptidyl-prolyl cis-trans isomerase FkpA
MKKNLTILLSAALVIFLAACSSGGGFKKTKSGLLYKIDSDGKGPVAKKGEFVKIKLEIYHRNKKRADSLLIDTADAPPIYVPVDSIADPIYHPAEIFVSLRKGDVAEVITRGDSLEKRQGGLQPFMKKQDEIVYIIHVLDLFHDEAAKSADEAKTQATYRTIYEKKQETQLKKDVAEIEKYLASKNIQAEKTPGGSYVLIQQQGTGPACDSGKIVSINYTGTGLDGVAFDSNIDTTFGHAGQPFTFQSGVSGAIPGMLEAIQKFRQGGKGYMYIPSPLAYGPQSGGRVKPNLNMMFYIEVTEVKDK